MDALAQNLPLVLIVVLAVVALVAAVVRLRRPRHVGGRVIRVIGVGGGGSNAVDEMVRAGTRGVDFIVCNTDIQALARSEAPRRLRIGSAVTRGLGAGGDPDIGRRAAEEDTDRIGTVLAGSELVFVTAGLGGGTGSGAAPIIAKVARDHGALTIGVVTRPFAFEGVKRRLIAEDAATRLRENVDALIVIPNDRVRDVVEETTSMLDAFRVVDGVLRHGIEGILEIISVPGLVNLDFADVRAVLQNGGAALMGMGRASGPDRAAEAAREAVASPLLEASIDGARAILFNVAGAASLTLSEITRAADEIRKSADPEASVIFGASFDERLADEVRVTVIATGLDEAGQGAWPANVTPTSTYAPARSAAKATEAPGALASDAPLAPATQVVDAPPSHEAAGTSSRPSDLEVPSFIRRRRSPPEGRRSP